MGLQSQENASDAGAGPAQRFGLLLESKKISWCTSGARTRKARRYGRIYRITRMVDNHLRIERTAKLQFSADSPSHSSAPIHPELDLNRLHEIELFGLNPFVCTGGVMES